MGHEFSIYIIVTNLVY